MRIVSIWIDDPESPIGGSEYEIVSNAYKGSAYLNAGHEKYHVATEKLLGFKVAKSYEHVGK